MLLNQAGCKIMTRQDYDALREQIRNAYAKAGQGIYLDIMALTDEIFIRTFKSRLEIVEEYAVEGKLLPGNYQWNKWEHQYAAFFYFKMKEIGKQNGIA